MGKGEQGEFLHRRELETVTKEEAAEYLRSLGYDAIEEDGAVLIRLKEVPTASERNKIIAHLIECGYKSSFGWRREKVNRNETE